MGILDADPILGARQDGHVVPTYATSTDMDAAIALGDLDDFDVALVEADDSYYFNDEGSAVKIDGSLTP